MTTFQKLTILSILLACLMLFPFHDAAAHHMMDGNVPATFMDGLLSGLAHPVIGLDHLAFVAAVGLMSLRFSRGLLLPLIFLPMGLLGTALHLAFVNLPSPEVLVAFSVLLFGLLLAFQPRVPLAGVAVTAALAGIAHGYAYGESIVGAEPTPLAAYLAGFTAVQFGVAMASRHLARAASGANAARLAAVQRLAGVVVGGAGMAFLYAGLLA